MPLALVAALIVAAVATGAVFAEPIRQATITVIDGIRFSDDVRSAPGLTHFGQPFWNTPLLDLAPEGAHQMIIDRGYPVRWQVEDRGGTVDPADDETLIAAVAAARRGRAAG